MRVLLVNDGRPGSGSGAEVHVARLAAALVASGDAVETFAPGRRQRGAAKVCDIWNPFARRALRERVARFDPDVVHFHNFARELSPSVLGVAPVVPKVLTVHDYRLVLGYEPGDPPWSVPSAARRVMSMLGRVVARRAIQQFVAVSTPMAARLEARDLRPVRVIPPLAELEPTGPDAGTRRDVIYAGRLSPAKGVDTLIAAWAAVADAHQSHTLDIIGDGPRRDDLLSVANRLAPGRVVFRGWLPESAVRTRLCRARVACLPSIADEGAPTAAIEAMLAGCAIIAADLPGTREMLADGAFGALLPVRDETAWSHALDALLRDDTRSTALGVAARDAARHRYRPMRVVAELHETYRDASRRG